MATHSGDSEGLHDESLDLGDFRRQPAEAGLSLDQLNAAFAEMLRTGDDPYAEEPQLAVSVEGGDPSSRSAAGSDSEFEATPRAIIEAMLFVGRPDSLPLSSHDMARRMRGVRPSEIDAWIGELNLIYDRRNCPYQIVAAGSGYALRLRDEHAALRDRFLGRARRARLSEAAVEVLAIVAYHQPLSSTQVQAKRGAASGHILSQLVRRQLLRLDRTKDCPRGMYSTTDRLLSLLGLEKLTDLPPPTAE